MGEREILGFFILFFIFLFYKIYFLKKNENLFPKQKHNKFGETEKEKKVKGGGGRRYKKQAWTSQTNAWSAFLSTFSSPYKAGFLDGGGRVPKLRSTSN